MIFALESVCTLKRHHHRDGNIQTSGIGTAGHAVDILCSRRIALLTEVSNMGLVLLIVLIILLLGGLPTWGYHSYGYGPSGIVGVLLIVLIVLLFTGRI
jgi:hypothetical protein